MLVIRLRHLYYYINADKLSEWNCDICATLLQWERNNITGAARNGFEWPSLHFPDRFKI